jgi:hypothetical protein
MITTFLRKRNEQNCLTRIDAIQKKSQNRRSLQRHNKIHEKFTQPQSNTPILAAKCHTTKRNRNTKKTNPCPTASNPHTSNALDLKLSHSFFTSGMSYLSTNLISALASLDMYDLTHFGFKISGLVTHNRHTTSQQDARSQSERP